MMLHSFASACRRLGPIALTAGLLAGCARYHARPLDLAPPLKPGLAALDRTLPDGRRIDIAGPLSPPALAALAVLNDPALAAERAKIGVADARRFAAGLLPDPNLQGGFAALLGGPGSAPSIAGTITQDLAALITRPARLGAARARDAAIRADVMWQEYQVAIRAATLATALHADRQNLAALGKARHALLALTTTTRRAVRSGNLAIAAASAADASLATIDAQRDAAAQREQTDHAALASLLGVAPDTVIRLAKPEIKPLSPALIARLRATLSRRRPDLIALRYGYAAADADLRAAILAQFPLVSLTVNGGTDTSRVATAGPAISLNLPIFNGNRGTIAVARATRAQLDAAFTAALAAAEGGTASARQALAVLRHERARAEARLRTASRDARAAQAAWRQGLIDSTAETNLIDRAVQRRTELIALDRKIAAGRIALAGLLGAGLPLVHIQSAHARKGAS